MASIWKRIFRSQEVALEWYHQGLAHANGEGVPQDHAKALKWYRKAAERGYADAQLQLGSLYEHGQGIPQDYAEAVKWYRKAAEQNTVDAQYRLAMFLASGQGCPQDYAEALNWRRKAAEQGHSSAQVDVGFQYYKGLGTLENYVEAAKWYRKAADQGHEIGQSNLAGLYVWGRGVPWDHAEAAKWYRMAAEQGNANAQYQLGLLCERGQGTPQDYAEAAKWYRKAAERGLGSASFAIGYLYDKGWGVQSDADALQWYRRAVDQGYTAAQPNLDRVTKRVDGLPPTPDESGTSLDLGAPHTLAPASPVRETQPTTGSHGRAEIKIRPPDPIGAREKHFETTLTKAIVSKALQILALLSKDFLAPGALPKDMSLFSYFMGWGFVHRPTLSVTGLGHRAFRTAPSSPLIAESIEVDLPLLDLTRACEVGPSCPNYHVRACPDESYLFTSSECVAFRRDHPTLSSMISVVFDPNNLASVARVLQAMKSYRKLRKALEEIQVRRMQPRRHLRSEAQKEIEDEQDRNDEISWHLYAEIWAVHLIDHMLGQIRSNILAYTPVLICRDCAVRYHLDLDVARSDAERAYTLGHVPARPTPFRTYGADLWCIRIPEEDKLVGPLSLESVRAILGDHRGASQMQVTLDGMSRWTPIAENEHCGLFPELSEDEVAHNLQTSSAHTTVGAATEATKAVPIVDSNAVPTSSDQPIKPTLPDGLLDELRAAIRIGDSKREMEIRKRIVAQGEQISRELALAALEFDPQQMYEGCTPDKDETFGVARTALYLIAQIGHLDDEMSQKVFERLIRGHSGAEAHRNNWGGLWSEAVETLESLGYTVVKPIPAEQPTPAAASDESSLPSLRWIDTQFTKARQQGDEQFDRLIEAIETGAGAAICRELAEIYGQPCAVQFLDGPHRAKSLIVFNDGTGVRVGSASYIPILAFGYTGQGERAFNAFLGAAEFPDPDVASIEAPLMLYKNGHRMNGVRENQYVRWEDGSTSLVWQDPLD